MVAVSSETLSHQDDSGSKPSLLLETFITRSGHWRVPDGPLKCAPECLLRQKLSFPETFTFPLLSFELFGISLLCSWY